MNLPHLPQWNLESLAATPRVYPDPARSAEGCEAIFYEGLPWKGRPTRVFAYYGLPRTKPGEKVPAMVLVHGGGGSALIPWVKLWVSRGYAAIAMDTCGCISGGGHQNHPRHADGGPAGWGGWDQIEDPLEDQWTFHAVAAVIRAHSLLRSFPEVDPTRIGLTGISWGGYLTCIAAGIDPRFAFAAPVYGCGFLAENSTWLDQFQKMPAASAQRWTTWWDPSIYLPKVICPMLWVNGTNDFAFPLDSWQKSSRLPTSPRTLSLRVRMEHGHGGPGENPTEIYAMAEALFRRGSPLAQIKESTLESNRLHITFASFEPIVRAELNVTTDSGTWVDRPWLTLPADLDAVNGIASASLPPSTTVAYLNLIDARDHVVSSEHVVIGIG